MDIFYPLLLKPVSTPILSSHTASEEPEPPCRVTTIFSADNDTGSIILNGPLAGMPLKDWIAQHSQAILGRRSPSSRLSIRCAFIESHQQGALEVHPSQPIVGKNGTAGPRTKLWYVTEAEPNARVLVGIRPEYTRPKFMHALNQGTLGLALQDFPAEAGDAYYLAPGRVHALTAGCRFLSLEQAIPEPLAPLLVHDLDSRATFHSPEAIESDVPLSGILFHNRKMARIRRESNAIVRNRKLPIMHTSPAFVLDEWRLISEVGERPQGQTFHFLISLTGTTLVETPNGSVQLEAGCSCLIPAAISYYTMCPTDGPVSVLKVGIP